ncbi:MAG: hypothetical protein COB14_05955 [Alphaproteobacteria bacterium]|nr:MAG: hypothetical protein COB14_05955 [Alphaproteobacteria bacterium]
MKILSIQIQPDLDSTFCKDIVLSELKRIGIIPEVQEGNNNGSYINFHVSSENLEISWAAIKSQLFNYPGFIKSSIITCEGDNGWDDYLLLHHFNEEESLDIIEC